MHIHPVILCGGNGSRLWPMSRGSYPKQFLRLTDECSLLQKTALRLNRLANVLPPIVVTNVEQRFLVAEQFRQIGVTPAAIVLEPAGRNTAPAAAAAACLATRDSADAMLLVLPADHVIANEEAFIEVVSKAEQVARDQYLVTFGITPTEPHSGFGYIRKGDALGANSAAFDVNAFIEKPDVDTAKAFLSDGGYLWNSGIFMFSAASYSNELDKYEPEVAAHARRAVSTACRDNDFLRLDQGAFNASPNISIDHAVMERTNRAAVIEGNDFGWNDIGSWSALADMAELDATGNALVGDVLSESVTNSYIRAEHRLVAAIGLDNLVIVETPDAVLVANRDRTQDVKKIVEKLSASGRSESSTHRRVVRPWGWYESIDNGDRFQVKRIVVNPGAQLSLQMHHHRAEHWVVVKGTACVTNGDDEKILSENQSTFIPLGVVHRLSNPGKIALELIEVQSGAYLGEDDIVRLDDTYGRLTEKSFA